MILLFWPRRRDRADRNDVHRMAAARVFGIPLRRVTEHQYLVAKRRAWALAHAAEPGTLLQEATADARKAA